MDPQVLQARTKRFALEIIRLLDELPRTRTAEVITKQLLRCATSAAANYRATCKAKSHADFIAKMSIVEEESDESLFWLELLKDLRLGDDAAVLHLMDEARQLTAIFTASGRTARTNHRS
jgi:four helix bundle protein